MGNGNYFSRQLRTHHSSSKNSTRGEAKVKNVVDCAKGRITNVVDFAMNKDGTEPTLKQLNVVLMQ